MAVKHVHMQTGILEVISGPMFSGKSEELIRRLRRSIIAKQNVAVFKHALDDRKSLGHVVSHNGTTLKAFAVQNVKKIYDWSVEQNIDVIGIDEVQFFSIEIIDIIMQLIEAKKRVIVAGLDLDFRGIPFGPMPTLLALADDITKLRAICCECGTDAHFTQRLVNGKAASFNDPTILVGAQESYQARCRECYEIDKKPIFNSNQLPKGHYENRI